MDALAATAGVRPAAVTRLDRTEVLFALAAFAALCAVALSFAPRLVEPDDHAYQASIVAIAQGHWLTLSTAQADALGRQLNSPGPLSPSGAAAPVVQWVQLADGRWISEKDPGYPFLAAPFQTARHHPAGAAVLRRARLPGPVRRRPPLAGPLRRRRRGRPVLHLGRGAAVRLAGLHADVHRRLADRRGHRRAAVGGPGRRGDGAAADLGGPGRVRGAGGRGLHPLHRHRGARLRRRRGGSGLARCGRCRLPRWPGGWVRSRRSASAWPSSTASCTAAR